MDHRPRVLILSLAYSPFIGGAEVAVQKITDRLSEFDFEMITVNLDGKQKKEEMIGGVKVIRLGSGGVSKYLFPLTAYREASRRHKMRPYDLIWAIMANQAGVAGALFKKRFKTVPFLLTLQEGDDLESLAYRLRLLIPRIFGVFRKPDQIQVISNYLGQWARELGAKCPITVIPNGVDLSSFQLLGSSFKNNKKENKVLITTSRLVRKNGIDTLIESLKFLPDNVRLQILGSGPEEKILKLKAKSLNLEARIEFLGHVLPDKVAEYLAQADIFARPSRSEGLGNSFLEAMAAGLPTIGTPVGGIPDFLHDPISLDAVRPNVGRTASNDEYQTGWLCEVDNPKSLADKVQYILDPTNADLVARVKEQAKRLVAEKYDWDKIAVRIGKLLSL